MIMIGLIMQLMENKILVLACLNIFCTLPLQCVSLWLPLGSESTDREPHFSPTDGADLPTTAGPAGWPGRDQSSDNCYKHWAQKKCC